MENNIFYDPLGSITQYGRLVKTVGEEENSETGDGGAGEG
jgi:hypothetical protein